MATGCWQNIKKVIELEKCVQMKIIRSIGKAVVVPGSNAPRNVGGCAGFRAWRMKSPAPNGTTA